MQISENDKQALAAGGAQRYLDIFALAVDPKFTIPFHVDVLLSKLQEAYERVRRGEKVRMIVCMPPRHGKSESATVKFPAWITGKEPSWPVICCSYNTELATDFGIKTRDIVRSDSYQTIFKTRLRPDQKAKGRWLTEVDGKALGGSYTSTGIGGSITGRGFKIGIIDDPFKSREEAESELNRERVWEWYKGTFYTRQEGISAIIVIATRWSLDDLTGRLLAKQEQDIAAGVPEEEIDRWEVINFPAVCEEMEIIEGKQYRQIGDPLWPEKFPLSQLRSIQNTLGRYEWASQYQQNPISSETQEFFPEYFKYYEDHELRLVPGLKFYTLVDLAHSEKKENHNTVVRTIAKAPHLPQIYLVEEAAGKMDPGKTVDAIFFQQERYQSEVWIEGVGYQKSLKYWIEERQRRDQRYFVVNILKNNNEVSKHERIRGLIPMYRAGVILHRRTGEDAALEREALSFPSGKLDDRLDCLANLQEAVMGTTPLRRPKKRLLHRPMSETFGG